MSDTPRRIRLKRTKGWRMPDNTVKVDRSTRWGNPNRVESLSTWNEVSGRWVVTGIGFYGPFRTEQIAASTACVLFRRAINEQRLPVTAADIRAELAGKNLACWCPPDAPCHADVLIEIANRPETA